MEPEIVGPRDRRKMYTLFGEVHVIGYKESMALNAVEERGRWDGVVVDGIPDIQWGEPGPPRPREMLCETSLDMQARPGAVPEGVRPIEKPSPVVRNSYLTRREKAFIDEHLLDYPVTIIAMAIGANPNTVQNHVQQTAQEPRLALRRKMFGEYDAMVLRKKFLMPSLPKSDFENE